MLTKADIRLILSIITEKYGSGYTSEIRGLQIKLSIMLEVAIEE
jgi:hypothetical protein